MKKWRIVQTDNFGYAGERPGSDEHFVLFPMTEKSARSIAMTLNQELDSEDSAYYKVERTGYVLQVFKP